MEDRRYYFILQQRDSISNLIPNEQIRKIYNQLFLFIMEDNDRFKKENHDNNTSYFDCNEQKLLEQMIKAKFVTYHFIHIEKYKETENDEEIKSIPLPQFIDAVICFDQKCCIFKRVEYSFITRIINKLKEEQVILIDSNVDLYNYREYLTDEQVEIYKFCFHFIKEIENNEFVQSTITSITAYIIRRYFCPTNYFSIKTFFNFHKRNEKKTYLFNRINKFLFLYKEEGVFIEDRIDSLLNAINDNYNEKDNYQIQDFKESDFITLRTIYTNDKFAFYLVIHIESLYIFMMKKSFDFNKKFNEMEHEIHFCQNYSHRCITPFYGFLKENEKIVGFIYEFMCNGTLEDFQLNTCNKMYSLMAMNRIAEGIDYLHSNSLIHRDLKPHNIFIDHDFLPYISDFDTVKNIKDSDELSTMTDDFGSPLYISPEQASWKSISYPTDIYSFGLIIYFLFEKNHMRLNNNDSYHYLKGKNDKILLISNVSENLQNLYLNCIKFEACDRPNIKEIRNIINEEIKSFCSVESNFEFEKNDIKTNDILFFYENILSQQNNHTKLLSCFDNILNFHYSILSKEKNKNPEYIQSIGVLYYYGKILKQNYLKAKKFFELAFKQDNFYGSYLLGKMYFEGQGVSKNYFKAKNYFEISSDSYSLDKLGYMYEYGLGVETDYKKSEKYFQLAAMKGNSYALINLGLLYENVYKDYNKARKLYIQSTMDGMVDGYFNLGKLYEEGKGCEQDYKQAIKFYEEAAKYNSKDALFQLGKLYQNGHGVEKNINKAINYYLASAHKNNAIAYIVLGSIYSEGYEIARDYSKAKYFYEKALELDSSFAAYALGIMYESGLGIERDSFQALKFFELSASKNNSYALKVLGDCYERGYLVKQDYSKALHFYFLAAKQNNSFASVGIGNLYKHGHGVKKSIIKMFSYYFVAAQQNNPIALFYLGEFYSNAELYQPEIEKAIECFLKCSKIVYFDNFFEEVKEQGSIVFYLVHYNSYRYPSFNNIGLIYITVYEDPLKAREYIKEAGLNEYSFGQNNLGLLNQLYFNEIENAKYLFEKASKKHFALAEYNLGCIEEKEGKIEKAIEFFIRASDDENEKLIFQNAKINDKRFKISKMFIICLTNMKLTNYFFSKLDFEKSKISFIRCFRKLIEKSLKLDYKFHFLFDKENGKNCFSYIGKFILNFPLFHIKNQSNLNLDQFIDSETNLEHQKLLSINKRNLKSNQKHNDILIKNDSLDMKQKMNICSKYAKIETKYEEINIKNIDDKEIIFDDPGKLFDFILLNKKFHDIFLNEIKSIIDIMNKILYKPPYHILFGRIKIEKTKEKPNTNSNKEPENINQLFYEGLGLEEFNICK